MRETLEESGFLATDLILLGTAVEAPGISSSTCHIYRANVHRQSAPALEAGEEWEVELLSQDELRAHIRDGTVRDASSLAAFALMRGEEQ